ncbi:MAG: outer membrane beta-barrel protein, partial [Candidatus Thiodiazotropha sp. (ex Ustalcina ferruginea)]|nr:outer membrane beta-barrel protein [Candidatus Thiodiazotropha sp. (ex Ustalcina ferruginea)]
DKIVQIGGGLSYRIPVSRQILTLEVEAFNNNYDRFDFLDHTSGLVNTRWDWLYGSRWDGVVRASYVRDLQGFEESKITEKDIRDQWIFFASGNYAISSRWQLHIAAARKDQHHNLSSRQDLDRVVDRGVAEIRYKTPRRSYLGYKTVIRSAELPNQNLIAATLVENSYREYENSLTIKWVESVRLGFTGRLGYTRREYDSFSERDFSGVTWQFDLQWSPQSRYGLNALLWRDLDVYSDLVSSCVTETGGSLEGVWVVSPKLSLKADVSRKIRNYDGDPDLSQGQVSSRQDRVVGYGLSAEYAIRERLRFNLGYLVEDRESNEDARRYDYYNLIAGITATF